MKKLILLALTAVMMAGCKEKEGPNEQYYISGRWIEVVDSCEYVIPIGHKGNCKFCAERRKKELEELVIKLKGEEV